LRAELRRIAAIDTAQQRIGKPVDRLLAKVPLDERRNGLIAFRWAAEECSSSSAIRILVRTLKSRVSAVGTSLVGTRNMSPSGSATRRLRTM
jgi:hypothetical protein